jgi:hypothetical protein
MFQSTPSGSGALVSTSAASNPTDIAPARE